MAKIKAGNKETIVETNKESTQPKQAQTTNNPPSRRSIIEANQKRKIATIENNINAEVFVPESTNAVKIFRELRTTDSLDSTLREFWGEKISAKDMEKWIKLVDEIHSKIVEANAYGKALLVENGKSRGIANFFLRREIRNSIETKEKEAKAQTKETQTA
ncbi:hypothetical protein [uncultured Helicobacter sp.]|uniref:hypothetical protein n=1 Tax=uncultured Helicobacter sp. TaxID=175537 RepID=UPI002601C0A8|nr:hypothetical protein [uncultured Helicobacter sp.]